MNDEEYPESIPVTVWGDKLEMVLADMLPAYRLKIKSKFRQYRRYSKESLERQLEGLIKTGNRILAQYRGTKGSKEREWKKFCDHPIYQSSDGLLLKEKIATARSRFNQMQGSRYDIRLKQLDEKRLDNATEKAIIRYVLKEKEVEVQ